MQICHDHWNELKNAICQRGMWKLVSPDKAGHPPVQIRSQSLTGRSLDPLDMAGHLISSQAVMALGEYLESRNYCPLCEVEHNLGHGFSHEWIEVNANTVLELCRIQHQTGND